MTTQPNYKKTLTACYFGFITQAITANYIPLLFLTFRNTYGIPLEQIALIPLVFFLTQLVVDLAASSSYPAQRITAIQSAPCRRAGRFALV